MWRREALLRTAIHKAVSIAMTDITPTWSGFVNMDWTAVLGTVVFKTEASKIPLPELYSQTTIIPPMHIRTIR
jgi:hypothetical protein